MRAAAVISSAAAFQHWFAVQDRADSAAEEWEDLSLTRLPDRGSEFRPGSRKPMILVGNPKRDGPRIDRRAACSMRESAIGGRLASHACAATEGSRNIRGARRNAEVMAGRAAQPPLSPTMPSAKAMIEQQFGDTQNTCRDAAWPVQCAARNCARGAASAKSAQFLAPRGVVRRRDAAIRIAPGCAGAGNSRRAG